MANRNITVTMNRNGRRTFGDHDDRWVDLDQPSNDQSRRGGGGKYNSRGYRGKGGGGPFNKYRSSSGGYRGGYGNANRGNRGRGGGRGGSNFRNRGGINKYGGDGPGPRSRIDDEGDTEMAGDTSSSKRFTPYGSRPDRAKHKSWQGGTGRYAVDQGSFSSTLNTSDWFKVTIPKGKKSGKDVILNCIAGKLDLQYTPLYFHFEMDKAVFYFQDSSNTVAESLRSLSNRISLPNGYKMILIVRPCSQPAQHLDESSVEKLKVCMSNRYDPSTKTLNLSCLFTDSSLNADNLHLALNRTNVMKNVISIIAENIPELEGLDISDNKLYSLDDLKELVSKAPSVLRINLGKNKLKTIEELDKISGWNIQELVLDGNDLCDKFKDNSTYISAVRKRFPKVLKLDTNDLPPPIVFEIDTATELPPVKGNFFPNLQIQELVVRFLKLYVSIYDSDNRQGLVDAYSEDALFSLSAAYNSTIEYNQPKLHDYMSESRNFLKTYKGTEKRSKTLKKGKISIIAHLCSLPKTTHDVNSFVVDVEQVLGSLMSFTVSGVFKESEGRPDRPAIRAFSRYFITKPMGEGMVIVNDMLTITNASQKQLQAAFKHPAPTPSSSPVPDTTPTAPFQQVAAKPSFPYTPVQSQMIESFVRDSGMNAHFSTKCLEENAWNYEKAGQIFLELKQQNKIPPEAFVK